MRADLALRLQLIVSALPGKKFDLGFCLWMTGVGAQGSYAGDLGKSVCSRIYLNPQSM